jgi:hypothetical protein
MKGLLVSSAASILLAGAAGSGASPATATLSFAETHQPFAGTFYGIDAVDSEPRVFAQRLSTEVAPGLRTVWYSCPGAKTMVGGERLTFEFAPGRHYALVCRDGRGAELRELDEC